MSQADLDIDSEFDALLTDQGMEVSFEQQQTVETAWWSLVVVDMLQANCQTFADMKMCPFSTSYQPMQLVSKFQHSSMFVLLQAYRRVATQAPGWLAQALLKVDCHYCCMRLVCSHRLTSMPSWDRPTQTPALLMLPSSWM